MKVEIGFSLQQRYALPITQFIPLLKEQGFSAVSPLWAPELDLALLASCVQEHNMLIQSLHATYTNIPLLWKPKEEGALFVFQNVMQSIEDCTRFGIATLVVHGWQGLMYSFPKEPLDFYFFDKLVQYADAKGVSIAFENLEGEEYLDALMTRYLWQSNVGYCWDSGHDNCYPHKIDFLEKFGERLIMTHLNDNFGLRDADGIPSGNDDLHLLPYDGIIAWDKALCRLQKAKRQNILNFEIKIIPRSKAENDLFYAHLSLEDFVAKAGGVARLIAEKYAELLD
ncbi:MAG: TIM barrel protein [Clostridia bacterium]|nr:TIM barrel protein [Clostridia bacterium]